jgi:hypothetical protein
VIRVNFLLSISDPMRLQGGGGGGGGGEQEKSVNGASIACETDLKCCVEAVSINQQTTISYVTQEPAAAHAPIMMFGCL